MKTKGYIQLLIDCRIGGPHLFALAMYKKNNHSDFLFAGSSVNSPNISSLLPLFYIKFNLHVLKMLQYFINFLLLTFYLRFVKRIKNKFIIIHSIKNYPAIFACIVNPKNMYQLVLHEQPSYFDIRLIKCLVKLYSSGYLRNIKFFSVAKCVIPKEFKNNFQLLRYKLPDKEKDLLRVAWDKKNHISPACIKIIMIGNISPVKNQAFFLKLLSGLEIKFEVTLFGSLTGNNNYIKIFKSAAEQFRDTGNRLILSGFVNKEDIWSKLYNYDLFCLPSISEAAPLVLYEMRETGIPIFSSDIGDCAEVLGNYKQSFLLPPDELYEHTFKDKLQKLLNYKL